jgi:branched-chain amino acid transport system substrate-binding protein
VSSEPIYIGVSGPLTGDRAQYGAQWKKGFDLALAEINGAGGVKGRPLQYIFEDSQSDPKQSVVIAQKFVSDPRIVIELGDFSSTASMAASQIYQRGGLVQFGFTNSHPDFTYAGGDYTWSTSVTQNQASPALADFAVKTLGLKKLAVFQINNDWGKSTIDLFAKRVQELGAEIVASQSYLDSEKDFRSAITTVRDAKPDGIILISYQADGALIAQQLREAGLSQPLVGSAAIQSPDYTKLGG